MSRTARLPLDTIVDALAGGDAAFVSALIRDEGARLAAAALAAGARPGRGAIPPIDHLVQEVALAVADLAPSRRPGEPPSAVIQRAAALVAAAGFACGTREHRGASRARCAPAPPGGVVRTLHLVDLENLAGGPWADADTVDLVWRRYEVVAGVGPADTVQVAADKSLYTRMAFTLPRGIRFRPATGPDGADRRLLADAPTEWIVERFDRLVIGSGDGAFADRAAACRQHGVAVHVVAVPGTLARRLALAADEVRELARPRAAQATAAFASGARLRVSASTLRAGLGDDTTAVTPDSAVAPTPALVGVA